MTTQNTKHYAVVTFGTPAAKRSKIFRSEALARLLADSYKGTGSCSAARVLECDTAALARTADISVTRDGERTVYSA